MSAWVKSVYVAVAVFVYMHACSLCLHGLSLCVTVAIYSICQHVCIVCDCCYI